MSYGSTNRYSPASRANPGTPKRANNRGMNTVKTNKGGKLRISSKTQLVDPPKGFHWMLENGRYFLMRGEFKPHPGAVRKAKFKLADHG